MDYITSFKCKPSLFYVLPKIHKSQIIDEVYQQSPDIYINVQAPQDLKLRCIIAGSVCEAYRLSNFSNYF